jgi:hypothetical protein
VNVKIDPVLGHGTTKPATKPSTRPRPYTLGRDLPDIIQWSMFDVAYGMDFWLMHARDRFENPVIFACHGEYETYTDTWGNTRSEWFLYPDKPRKKQPAYEAARFLKNMYPDRDVVMIVCNKQGHIPKLAGVWVGMSEIWCVPDVSVLPFTKPTPREIDPNKGGVGSIWEFVEGN